jgi:hypothetical protein
MNWFESERTVHEHVLRAEKAARQYPHLAHLVDGHLADDHLLEQGRERRRTSRRLNHALVSLGGLLVTWGEHLQERWASELPACTGAPIANN